MAVTDGPGNGNWTRDETILALELYQKLGKVPDARDAAVVNLSQFLRTLPLHPPEKRNNSFRNPDGVAFKIGNLESVRTGKGLKNVSKVDREVWAELGDNLPEVRSLAAQIRKASAELAELSLNQAQDDEQDHEYFAEGGALAVLHRRLERSRYLRKKLLRSRLRLGALKCDACDRTSPVSDERLLEAAFEAHHKVPLAASGLTMTRVADLALLCATCHRLLHRAMVVQKRWISLPQFRELLR